MTKAEKEKIFEIADMVKDIVKLDENSFEKIKFVIGSYKEVKNKINEVCKKYCLDIGTFEHHKFILEKLRDEHFEHYLAFDNGQNVLTQMFAEIDAEREKQEGEKNV